MKVEQIYTGCLAQGAYYIESNGEAAIIDPLREVQPYLDKAQKEGAEIKYVLETHFHADFVSGHIDLAKKTGASIVYGPNANPKYDVHIAEDGEELQIGDVKLKVLHTPGHTMESTCYLLLDENGKPHSLFSGDTLFLGDVGRPDLAVKSDVTIEELAGHMFESLRNKIMTLPDEVVVYPGHGAGSACGKNMRSDTVGTIGEEKATNYALRADMSKADFVKEVTDGLMPPPSYFPQNAALNIGGYESLDNVMSRGLQALSNEAFEAAANETGAIILDTRNPGEFGKGFIPNSINIGIDGGFAPWVGTLIPDIKQPLLLVTERGREEEVVTRLARVGYDSAIGYLKDGFEGWVAAGKDVERVKNVSPTTFADLFRNEEIRVVDVRKPGEYESEHVRGAENLPLDFINDLMDRFQREGTTYLHCAGGYRSMIAASILKARGFDNMVNVLGGFNEICDTDIPMSDAVCPTTVNK